jgi:hypothetical protein
LATLKSRVAEFLARKELLKRVEEDSVAKKAAPSAGAKGNDIQMYSGLVRMFGGLNYTDPLEDMMIERFPATSEGNARQFLISAARQWLDDSGLEQKGGIQIMYCGFDGQPAPSSKAVAVVHKGGRPAVAALSKTTNAVSTVYRAFKCPIAALCKATFVGRYDHFADTLIIHEEK